ncbi:RnfABCDGE type electron transport complex subunit D [Butyrivibrio fibrisolvens]|uniref:Ion-translocating oxidoreductase complex subunit D n=1 Tax=Butyrivibrio fibrisolvens TaxID=831 RepID=A0A317G2K2_BUTFI|nr:RnfABCDGE type electron transport complex subunit D [Butyrivibrio fibrisolvens]PWT27727.1 Na+-transporting NADH:ubiquinone oxidoreductase subunit D [Butyrivibrio fibrisolvens]
MSEFRNVSSNPHVRSGSSTTNIMLWVIIGLCIPAAFGVFNFGLYALVLILLSIATTVITEYVYEKLMHKPNTIGDLSAVVTGLLIGLNIPSTAPFWLPIIGGIFAIVVVKELFGGLGQNFMNPALGARCFLVISFPRLMTDFVTDTYTGATPLAALKAGEEVDVMKMIEGFTGGVIGETSMIAIVIGACVLIMAGVIDLRIPGSYIVSFAIFVMIFGGRGWNPAYLSAQLAGGGLMLGAFFMATDYVTSPITNVGKYIYGIVLGLLTGIFRIFGSSAEGVSYAIIIGNLLVPLIERWTLPRAFGIPKKSRKKEAKA